MLRYQLFFMSPGKIQLIGMAHQYEHALVMVQEWGDVLWDSYEQVWIGPDGSMREPKNNSDHPLNMGMFVAEVPLHEQEPSAIDKITEIRKLLHASMPCTEQGDCLHCELARLTI